MQSLDFPQSNLKLAKNQPQYQTLYAHVDENDPSVPMTVLLGLTDEEINQVVITRSLFHTQLTFGKPFHPIRMSTTNPFDEGFIAERKITDLAQVNTDTPEGKLLLAAISILTTTIHRDKTPWEVITIINEAADNIFS